MEREALDALRMAGFNEYEARIIYALLKLREADVKSITKYSNVPRTKAYDVLRSLVKKGFVMEINTQPLRFSIPDAETFIEQLKEEKRKEYTKLEKGLTSLKEILPVLVESGRKGENYILRFGNPTDVIKLIENSERPRVVVYTRKSEDFLKGLGDEEYVGPLDMVLTPSELFLPLHPLGEPRREHIVVVFSNPYVMEMAKRWIDEVLAK